MTVVLITVILIWLFFALHSVKDTNDYNSNKGKYKKK